jgi:hypothetical protein
MKRGFKLHIALLLLTALVAITSGAYAQSNIEVFGQNRVQNRKFDWKFFDTKHFRVYHYDKAGRQLGRYVAEEAENNIKVVEKKLGGQFPQRFNIILYNSYDDYRQTNIGLKDEAQSVTNARAGSLNLVDDKLVVWFTGEHGDLKHQIRTGMSRVVMCKMIFGDNFKKMVKNALLLNLPQWVTDGYIAYLVDGWDAKANSEWKGMLEAQPDKGFYELSEQKPELAGKAFWKFISNQYGPGMVKSLLYAMQQKTSINKAMKDKENLNLKVTKAYDSCVHYYKDVYAMDNARQEMPDSAHGLAALTVPKDNSVIKNIVVSPRGSDVSYVAWKNGQYTVYTQKTKGGQLSPLLEGGQKDLTEAMDPNYPMLAWNNTGYRMAILYRKGKHTYLRIYNSLKTRIENYAIPDNRFDRVLSMSFTAEDDKMIFSAIKKSQTDLYMFTFKGSKMTNITDDVWDDVSPEYISGGAREGILFLSNRPKPNMNVPLGVNELPTGPMNVFFYNTKTQRSELLQCTDVNRGTVSQPIQYGNENFAYLYDSNGVNNKYVVLFARDRNNRDSAYSVPITNYNTSIISHQYNPASGDVADVIQVKDKYQVYFHDLQMPGVNVSAKNLTPTTLSIEKPEVKPPDKTKILAPASKLAEKEEQIVPEIKTGNAFQTEFTDTTARVRRRKNKNNLFKGGSAPDSSVLTEITDSAYVKMKPSSYRLSFKPDFFSIKLDNSLLFSQYQSIATNGGQFNNQDPSALTTLSLIELMEDHRITGGYQLPLTVSSSTYFLQYQNFKRRLDWGLLFLRSQTNDRKNVVYVDNQNVPRFQKLQLFKAVSSILQADFSYPLDRVRSIRFHTSMRQDKLIQKVTDTLSLIYDYPMPVQYTSISRLEYVFDNTISPATNTLNGDRFKVYAEYFAGLNKDGKYCYNIGADIRHYQKLYKNFISATRLAYGHSDGTNKVQYLVGGVDNNLFPGQPDANANQPTGDGYGFQMLVTSLRGYKQYARTGNNFIVLTNELRLPVFTTFSKRPIQSAILKNLQFVPFCDIASGWTGFLPTEGSMVKTFNYPTGYSFTGGLNNINLSFTSTQGLAVGYGFGFRTSVFGYFVRTDFAWNIEGLKKPMIYIALGSDF